MAGNLQINFLDKEEKSKMTIDLDKVTTMPCLICDKEFQLKKELDDYLGHLFMEHRLVIADVQDISIIEEYLAHWKTKMSGNCIHYKLYINLF